MPDNVISRYPSAEPAALPAGITLPSDFVDSWIRKRRASETLVGGSAARVISE